mmetsp:Transcript_39266/g.122913  ORF Transcript_39266/g.122913 Transcript_39266/m.122913 type:complete len:295 (-) Transcript_39266:1937-2821(-)
MAAPTAETMDRDSEEGSDLSPAVQRIIQQSGAFEDESVFVPFVYSNIPPGERRKIACEKAAIQCLSWWLCLKINGRRKPVTRNYSRIGIGGYVYKELPQEDDLYQKGENRERALMLRAKTHKGILDDIESDKENARSKREKYKPSKLDFHPERGDQPVAEPSTAKHIVFNEDVKMIVYAMDYTKSDVDDLWSTVDEIAEWKKQYGKYMLRIGPDGEYFKRKKMRYNFYDDREGESSEGASGGSESGSKEGGGGAPVAPVAPALGSAKIHAELPEESKTVDRHQGEGAAGDAVRN